MKNVFIPSDFSEQSLGMIRILMNRYKNQKFNIYLFHTLIMPDSITDLLFISKKKQEVIDQSREFALQCNRFKYAHADRIHAIHQTLIYGTTTALFKQYLEANDIHFIAWVPDYTLREINKYSYDPKDLIRKCGLEVIDLGKQIYEENITRQLVEQIIFSEN